MARATTNAGAAAQPAEKKVAVESKYSSAEFAKAAGIDAALFGEGVTPDIVTAAFFVAGKHEATKAEAKEIVKLFLNRGEKR